MKELNNVKQKLKMGRSIARVIFFMTVVLFLALAAPSEAVAVNSSVVTISSKIPLENPKIFLIPSAGLELLQSWRLPLLSPVLGQIEKMPTGDQLNGFMKTSFKWGIETGWKFLSLLFALKVASSVFK
ncbi:MAG: hypothetical protein RIC07_12800 [Coleofasciculus sp. E1-EBD-02]